MSKISTKGLKKKAWDCFSKYIRLKYSTPSGYCKCVTCGRMKYWKEMQAGHFIQGRYLNILFDERCVHPQCYHCNIGLKGNYVEYYEYMLQQYGKEIIDDLRRLKHNSFEGNSRTLYESIIAKYGD